MGWSIPSHNFAKRSGAGKTRSADAQLQRDWTEPDTYWRCKTRFEVGQANCSRVGATAPARHALKLLSGITSRPKAKPHQGRFRRARSRHGFHPELTGRRTSTSRRDPRQKHAEPAKFEELGAFSEGRNPRPR